MHKHSVVLWKDDFGFNLRDVFQLKAPNWSNSSYQPVGGRPTSCSNVVCFSLGSTIIIPNFFVTNIMIRTKNKPVGAIFSAWYNSPAINPPFMQTVLQFGVLMAGATFLFTLGSTNNYCYYLLICTGVITLITTAFRFGEPATGSCYCACQLTGLTYFGIVNEISFTFSCYDKSKMSNQSLQLRGWWEMFGIYAKEIKIYIKLINWPMVRTFGSQIVPLTRLISQTVQSTEKEKSLF